MITKFKIVYFELIEKKERTSVWGCYKNAGSTLMGVVRWEDAWRQYCFYPEPDIVFSADCMEEVSWFIKNLRTFEVSAKIQEVRGV